MNRFPLDFEGRCALCRSGLRAFDAAWSFGAYGGTLRELVHLFKYRGVQPLADPLGRLLLRALPREESFELIVLVPLHWLRQWNRGFNQSEELARVVSRATGLPLRNVLRRAHATTAQAGLTNAARRRNVSRAFVCRRPQAVQGKRILLIDDVMTTGSTVTACARSLKSAGAARVSVLTVARADRRVGVRDVHTFESLVGGNVRNGQ